MMKRCLSLLLVVGLIAVLAVPVSAADSGNIGGWYDALEEASLASNGDNLFIIDGTETTFKLDIEPHRRLAKVDMLISYGNGALPTFVGVQYGDSFSGLTIVDLGNNICRAYGNITYALYEDLFVKVVKSGTSKVYYELLSCKVCALKVTDFSAQGLLYRSYSDSAPLSIPNNFSVSGNGQGNYMEYKLIPVRIKDWAKYDYITLFGSITRMALNSFRASIGNKGLPYTITYMESVPTGSEGHTDDLWAYSSTTITTYNDNDYIRDDSTSFTDGTIYGGSVIHESVVYGGAVLFTITIDLTGIDRTLSGYLDCFFTCIAAPSLGYAFNIQNATGSVVTADTSEVTWWNRFTTFMTDLFGSKDNGALDDLGSSSDSISQNTSQISDFEHSQQAVLDNNFAQIQGAISFTNFAAALVFVQKYTNMTFNGISKYAIVFTLPLFLGLFFYLCSRIPGITRWKTPPPRSPSPKSKGGGKP